MITIADLVQTMHEIDALKGRVCRNCAAGTVFQNLDESPIACRKGMDPYGPDDGCDQFQARVKPGPEQTPETGRLCEQRPAGGAVAAPPHQATHGPRREAGEVA